MSVASGGGQGDANSAGTALSGDGTVVAFSSESANLVFGDSNGVDDIFVHDRRTGATTRVSVASDGSEANGASGPVWGGLSLSATGRYVAFTSNANNLVQGDTNLLPDVFVHDRQTQHTTRVSVATGGAQADGTSTRCAISADGRYVAFESAASNLVPGDSNGQTDIFVHDRQSNTTTRVNVATDGSQAEGGGAFPAISADGRYVAFASFANLVGDDNGFEDVFVHDRQTGTTTKVSVARDGADVDRGSSYPALSADGRYVSFHSGASNLVAGDTNGAADVFVHDQQTATTTRVSIATDGSESNQDSFFPAVSADGRYVSFISFASNLVAGDTNARPDVFLHDRSTGATVRVSVGLGGVPTDDSSSDPAISGDARCVGFVSSASNLVPGDTNGSRDVFVYDREAVAARTFLPAGDYDGDGRADVAVYRRSDGVWYIIRSRTNTAIGVTWGLTDDIPVPADYDGDHLTDPAVYRPSSGTWYVLQSTTGTGKAVQWGLPDDMPVPADYDGDGKADPTLFRASTGTWYELRTTTGAGYSVIWGAVGDVPVVADYDRDGKADPTVFRASTGTWYELRSTTGAGFGVIWGQSGDVPLAGDFDGDTNADPTVFRGSSGTWYELRSTTGAGYGVVWGILGDLPVVGDYDGDGQADPTVFRPSTSTWYQLRSRTGVGYGVLWGVVGDVPQ